MTVTPTSLKVNQQERINQAFILLVTMTCHQMALIGEETLFYYKRKSANDYR